MDYEKEQFILSLLKEYEKFWSDYLKSWNCATYDAMHLRFSNVNSYYSPALRTLGNKTEIIFIATRDKWKNGELDSWQKERDELRRLTLFFEDEVEKLSKNSNFQKECEKEWEEKAKLKKEKQAKNKLAKKWYQFWK